MGWGHLRWPPFLQAGLILFVLLSPGSPLRAQDPLPLTVPRITFPIQIDGKIEERAWQEALTFDLNYEISPGDNTAPPVKTTVRFAFDGENFLVALSCFDPDPDRIRARYADRDSAWADDFAGIILDTFNDQRQAYEFFVNPFGAQMDLTLTEPEQEDRSWDGIWSSAGRITDEGYEIEIAIPFRTLRFPNLDTQVWRFLVIRIYPREFRHEISSQPLDRNKNCLLCQAGLISGMEGARSGRQLEVVPTLTAISTQDRPAPEEPFSDRESTTEIGVSGTWGLTPNLALSGMVNPDFSQVETDSEEIDVNRRFALYYSEKRPFFLEGSRYFSTFMDVFYSRTVADPSWGVKVAGKDGRNGWGAFIARDTVTNILIPGNQGSDLLFLDQEVLDGSFRYRRDLGRDSTLGAIYTGRHGDGYTFDLMGGDGRFRLAEHDFINFLALFSQTRMPDLPDESAHFDGREREGGATYLAYEHNSRHWTWNAAFRDLDPDFRADLGFIPRVDYRSLSSALAYTHYGDGSGFHQTLSPGIYTSYTEDHSGELSDRLLGAELSFSLARQIHGEFNLERSLERYNGADYTTNQAHLWFNSRFSKAMTLYLSVSAGDGIDYTNERLADLFDSHLQFDIRFGRRIFLDFNLRHQSLSIAQGQIYTASIYYLKLLYHFNNSIFLRTILQYGDVRRDGDLYVDDVKEKERFLASQILFTYKINPFTLAFLGYADRGIEEKDLDRTTMNRTLFLKLSYAFRP
ncbi:MAG TPA: DUF5916 domain-containing protein [Thermoanaerobaculia bacterium]|nr:DUF5916 domain-containing protein [Thermoanaerobaculia bacterium]HUM30257.1 DUF5916 domain-containing protein [Thermoanaerobaculia bacterium]HXK68447.1 DUF5916 domain-containing protein [Thermoanaerobaculia bacterium]